MYNLAVFFEMEGREYLMSELTHRLHWIGGANIDTTESSVGPTASLAGFLIWLTAAAAPKR